MNELKLRNAYSFRTGFIGILCLIASLSGIQTSKANSALAPSTTQQVMNKLSSLGLSQCADRIDSILGYVARKDASDILLYVNPQKTDGSMVSFLVTRSVQNENYLATLDFALNESCSASYEMVRVWSSSCADVLSSEYASYANPAQIGAGFELRRANDHLHVAARQIGQAQCLTVQKEVIY